MSVALVSTISRSYYVARHRVENHEGLLHFVKVDNRMRTADCARQDEMDFSATQPHQFAAAATADSLLLWCALLFLPRFVGFPIRYGLIAPITPARTVLWSLLSPSSLVTSAALCGATFDDMNKSSTVVNSLSAWDESSENPIAASRCGGGNLSALATLALVINLRRCRWENKGMEH